MNPNQEKLVARLIEGEATEHEVDQLVDQIRGDDDLTREVANLISIHGQLGVVTEDEASRKAQIEKISTALKKVDSDQFARRVRERFIRKRRFRWAAGIGAAAALLVAGLFYWSNSSSPIYIATLKSSENAAWESRLPTIPGSPLTTGILHLKTGIATIQFSSGAEITLEAPAQLELITPLRCLMTLGTAVVDVPESAIGFVMDTPNGKAIDYGTRFAVVIDRINSNSEFEVLDGEISVQSNNSTEEFFLKQNQSAQLSKNGVTTYQHPLPEKVYKSPSNEWVRIETHGKTASIIANNRQRKRNPDLLTVKREQNGGIDSNSRRSFFAFDLDQVNSQSILKSRLRLNLVPSGKGFAGTLPKINRFAVYAFNEPVDIQWRKFQKWEDSPGPDKGILIGKFELPRSQQRGAFTIESNELAAFLQSYKQVTCVFLIVRETGQKDNRSLVHAFASDTHPEASGPVLEIQLARPNE